MGTWGNFYFFPLAFGQTGSDRAYRTEHTQNDNADFFDARQENGLWRFSLGGLKFLASYIDEWDAFRAAVKGQWKPFLFRLNSKRFEILKEQPGGIGTGNGSNKVFQLVKTRAYSNGPANKDTEVVRFPLHGYPEMRIPSGVTGKGPVIYADNEKVRLWVNGAELTSGWTLNRETGLVTFTNAPANGALIQVACKFFVLVHGQDYEPVENEGGTYTFSQGAELFQVASER